MGGALLEAELVATVNRAGFEDTTVTQRYDCIPGTSREAIARWLGVKGMNLLARKPRR